MASRRLPKHLQARLGTEAGGELVTILDEIRADSARAAARFDAFNDRFEALNDRFTVLERTMNDRFATLEVKVADAKADLMKWSFLFWCGAVASIAALAGVLR